MTSHKPAGSGCNRHFCDGHHTRARQPCRVRGVARRKLAYDPTRTFLVAPTSLSQSGIVRPATDPGAGRMRRREFLGVLGGAAAGALIPTRRAGAQVSALRVGSCAAQPRATSFLQGFDARMSELGYTEGRNYTMDYIDLQGRTDRYSDAMQQLVARKADVLVAFGPEDCLKAALAATQTIPIVMTAIDFDPVALGYVTSLARPTGNVTGTILEQNELAQKPRQLVKDAFPAISKAMGFWDRL